MILRLALKGKRKEAEQPRMILESIVCMFCCWIMSTCVFYAQRELLSCERIFAGYMCLGFVELLLCLTNISVLQQPASHLWPIVLCGIVAFLFLLYICGTPPVGMFYALTG